MCRDLRTSIVQLDGIVLVVASGDIDIVTGAGFAQVLEDAIGLAETAVELDLGHVTHFGSEGVRRLLQARAKAQAKAVPMRVASISDQARTVLEITHLTHAISLPESGPTS